MLSRDLCTLIQPPNVLLGMGSNCSLHTIHCTIKPYLVTSAIVFIYGPLIREPQCSDVVYAIGYLGKVKVMESKCCSLLYSAVKEILADFVFCRLVDGDSKVPAC